MTDTQKLALKISAVLWIIWGLVHAFGGIMTLYQPTAAAFAGIADAVEPALLENDYHAAVGGILNQHGFNLLWVGLATTLGAFLIWRGNMTSIWVTATLGGLFDVGYLVYVDLAGYANFFPGTVMTIVSASAVAISFWVWLPMRNKVVSNA